MDAPATVCPASGVSRADSEALIATVARLFPEGTDRDRREGIFGPTSMSWTINRESALFLGAGRAALLQLAHPWVATALEQHSSLMSKPIGRFHNTFRTVFAMIFGSLDQALAAARHLHSLHSRIQGQIPEDVADYRRGSEYQANEVAALRWVFATLLESAVLAYEWFLPPLGSSRLAAYYAESKILASLFGLPAAAMPEDWPAFLAYCRQMEQSSSLGVTSGARSMAHNLLAGAGSWIKPPHWCRNLTASWLPGRFRDEFGLTFSKDDQSSVDRTRRRLPRYYGMLPAAVRFVGPWHEAQARLRGRSPGFVARANNRFWIGEGSLPFAGDLPFASGVAHHKHR